MNLKDEIVAGESCALEFKRVPNEEREKYLKTVKDARIVELISGNPSVTIPDLEGSLGLSREGVRKALKRLKDANVICRVGPDKGGHWEAL